MSTFQKKTWKTDRLDKYWCQYCKIFIVDNKSSKQMHENGQKHKDNVKQFLDDMSRSNLQKSREDKKTSDMLRRIEEDAKRAYANDIKEGVAAGPSSADSAAPLQPKPHESHCHATHPSSSSSHKPHPAPSIPPSISAPPMPAAIPSYQQTPQPYPYPYAAYSASASAYPTAPVTADQSVMDAWTQHYTQYYLSTGCDPVTAAAWGQYYAQQHVMSQQVVPDASSLLSYEVSAAPSSSSSSSSAQLPADGVIEEKTVEESKEHEAEDAEEKQKKLAEEKERKEKEIKEKEEEKKRKAMEAATGISGWVRVKSSESKLPSVRSKEEEELERAKEEEEAEANGSSAKRAKRWNDSNDDNSGGSTVIRRREAPATVGRPRPRGF